MPRQWLACMLTWLVLAAPVLAGDRLLVVNRLDSSLSVRDADSGTELARLATGVSPHEVAVSPDAAIAVVADYGDAQPGNTLTVVDLGRLAVARTIDLGAFRRPHGLAFLPDGRLLVTAEGARRLLLVDPLSGEVLAAMETHGLGSHMVASDGERAFVANMHSGTVSIVDIAATKTTAVLKSGLGTEAVALGRDGAELWLVNPELDAVLVLDAESFEGLARIPCPGHPERIAMTPDGSRALVTAMGSGEVVVIDTAARAEIARLAVPVERVDDLSGRLLETRFPKGPLPIGIAISDDGARAWISSSHADRVSVLDLASLTFIGQIDVGPDPDGLAFVPGD